MVKQLGFPDKMFTKLRYYSTVITWTTGTPVDYKFRMNWLYDPDAEVGGGQPMYRDQFAAIYNRYKVSAVKFKVRFINSSPTQSCTCLIFPSPDSTTQTDIQAQRERNHVQSQILAPVGSKNVITFKAYYDI